MANRGVQFFYYTQNLPTRAIAIAQVSTLPASPASLTDINNTIYSPGSYSVVMHDSPFTVFTAPDIEQSVAINGDVIYQFSNQFFELTDQVDTNGNPLYYQHPLPIGVTQVTVLDLSGNIVPSGYVVSTLVRGSATNTYVLHSFPNVNNPLEDFVPYQVRYIDANGNLQLDVLKFQNVISYDPFNAGPATYTTTPLSITLFSTGVYYIRWYAENGYQLLPPYGTTPNDPWFLRVRYNPAPTPPEWATQVWTPQRPYMLATWVPGTVLDTNLIQFERDLIYFNNGIYPDVLVYDSTYTLKYALAGKTGNGFLYPWQLNQFTDIDPNTGIVEVALELDPTDIVFGFYSYQEPDVIFTSLDMNPYTNPSIRNTVVQFYQKTNGQDLLHYIYYVITNGQYPVQNYLVNPSNPALPPWSYNPTFTTFTPGQLDPVGGTNAVQMSWSQLQHSAYLINQIVTPPSVASQTFVFSAWLRTTSTPFSIYMLMEDQVASHVLIGNDEPLISVTSQWTYYEITGTTYPTSTYVLPGFYNPTVISSMDIYGASLTYSQPLAITNDPNPTLGTNNYFGTATVGQATSVGDFTITDVRQRGGGLAPAYQDIPQAVNFWDLGYWDGKPFPAGGAMIIYLPVTLQNTFSTDNIAQIIGSVIPMGTIPIVRYYDQNGNETVA